MARVSIIPGMLLVLAGCGASDDGPVLETVPPAPAPFAASVTRGIEGDYQLTGGGWYLNHAAYSHAHRTAFDRVTVLGIDPVRVRAVRIVQPAGYGPPFEGVSDRMAIGEIELYASPGGHADRYVRDRSRNLAPAARWSADATAENAYLEWLTDGRLRSADGQGAWASPSTPVPHWIEGRFTSPITLDQIVITWPLVELESPWFGDVPITEGLRARRLDVYVETDDGWRRVDATDHRPGGRHDGPLLQEWFGLPKTPSGRLAHLDALARGEPRHGHDPDAAPAGPGEVALTGEWRIAADASGFPESTRAPGSDPALVARAAGDLHLELVALGLDVESPGPRTREASATTSGTTQRGTSPSTNDRLAGDDPDRPTIILGALTPTPDAGAHLTGIPPDALAAIRAKATVPGAYGIVVTPTRVWCLGVDPLAVRYAVFRLVERLATRGGPVLQIGSEWRRPAFAPRIASGVAFGDGGPDDLGFPDGYLRQFVRMGLDGLYLFQAGAVTDVVGLLGSDLDPALDGDAEAIAAYGSLVQRARAQGLGVTWMLTFPGTLPPAVYERHPTIRGDGEKPYVICLGTPEGRRVVEDSARRLVTRIPGLSGVLVLRSELSHTCGGRLSCPHCLRTTTPDADPIEAVVTWVRDAIHGVDPAVEVIALDWRSGNIPALDEARLPADVSMWARSDRLVADTPETDIRDVAPRAGFESLLTDHRRGRKLWVEVQLSHPFPLHAQPEVAALPLLWAKLTALRARAQAADVTLGVCVGNGSGLAPTPTQELGCTTLFWDPLPPRAEALDAVARRWFGSGGAPDAVAAWWAFSDAIRDHARFPKYLSRRALNTPPGWSSSALAPSLVASQELLVAGWGVGLEALADAVEVSPPDRKAEAARQLRLARSVRTNLVALGHAAAWSVQVGAGSPTPDLLARLDPDRRSRATTILRDELDGTREAVDLAIEESWLRTHGFYRHAFGIPARMEKTAAMRRALP